MADDTRWQKLVARYQVPSSARAWLNLLSTLVPLLGLLVVMSLLPHWFLVPALTLVLAAFLVRTFVLMHDCGHGSFFRSRRLNAAIGFVTGVFALTPFAAWRREHAIHHATSGCLDERGTGDIHTLTVREYRQLGRWARLKYRAYRNPFVLLGLGPLWMLVKYRIPRRGMTRADRTSVIATNAVALGLFVAWSLLVGWPRMLLVYLPAALIAAAAGIWLFYVQHQYEGVYWARKRDWAYATAAVEGSSYYRLPRVLDWVTGSIGFHHVHHLSPRIPLYNLRRCHRELALFGAAHVLTLRESLRTFRLKLWDEDAGRLVTFREARLAHA